MGCETEKWKVGLIKKATDSVKNYFKVYIILS